jgi:hypothetical protein
MTATAVYGRPWRVGEQAVNWMYPMASGVVAFIGRLTLRAHERRLTDHLAAAVDDSARAAYSHERRRLLHQAAAATERIIDLLETWPPARRYAAKVPDILSIRTTATMEAQS